MQGYLKVEATKNEQGREGLQLSCELEHVSAMDRFHVLQVVCDALHVYSDDLEMFCTLKKVGLFDALTERHTVCDEAIPEQGDARVKDMLKDILNYMCGGTYNEG